MAASNKSLLFFLGLISGTVIGAGFFVLNLNDFFKNLNSEKLPAIKELTTKKSNDYLSQSKTNNLTTDTNKSMNIQPSSRYNTLDTPLINVLKESDSLLNNSSSPQIKDETIVVRKDRLLSTKVIQIEFIDKASEANTSDSLLEQISGVKSPTGKSLFRRIEFWISPVNYKGYKQTQNKLVLFGINPDLEIKLYSHNDHIFMKYNMAVYELDFTEDFKQFEKTTDSSLIDIIQ